MNWIIACELSARVRDAMLARGQFAVSCDLLPSIAPDPHELHYIGDVRDLIENPQLVLPEGQIWDGLIAFPPCTFLCSSGLHWNGRVAGRAQKTEAALEFVRYLLECNIPRKALENPRGCISTRIRRPDQTIQPYMFGDDASKATDLWLENLPPLLIEPAKRVPGRWVTCNGKRVERWANQTDSGQNRLGPSETRQMERGLTYPGIAAAMAAQWRNT